MARRKSPAVDAPQTLEEAIALLDRYSTLLARLSALDAEREAAIAAIHAAHDAMAGPVEQDLKGLFIRLKPWWEVARDQLTDGKRKSIELGGCEIGTRIDNPSLKNPKGLNDDDVVTWLESLVGEMGEAISPWVKSLLRVKTFPEKAAIIKVLRGEPANFGRQLLESKGLKISQVDKFFIDRLPPKPAGTETIDTSVSL